MVAGQQRLEHRDRRRHARREQDASAGRTFEHRDRPLGMLVGRVVGPRIDAPLVIRPVGRLLEVGGNADRRRQGARHRIDLAQSLRHQRLRR
jgi:hypothetical protein